MKKEYIKPLTEIVPIHVKTSILDMSGEVNWGMGNQQTFFDDEDNSLPRTRGLWDEDHNSDDGK